MSPFMQCFRRALLPLALLGMLMGAGLSAVALGQDLLPERRREQFLYEPAYLLVPLPYSIPGIGSGWLLTALGANIAGSQTDAYAVLATGDVEGTILAVEDLFLLPEFLAVQFGVQNLNKVLINNYEKRGMDTKKDDFNLIELNKVDSEFWGGLLTLFERRLELSYDSFKQKIQIVSVRDADGSVLAEFEEPIKGESTATALGAVLDLTDDRQDPRAGLRVGISRSHSPPEGAEDVDYYVWNTRANIYLPLGERNTLVIHYFKSDAEVLRQGNTDEDVVRADLGLNCGSDDAECLKIEDELVERNVAQARYGTAASLGGQSRLRSYPQGRYQAAHALFYGTEFRWNLTEETTPFDYFIWKDVRTAVQLALFAETGTVGDTPDELGEIYRSSYGIGLRMISGSGFVYRADIASGEEGVEPTFIFSYPY